MEKTDLDVCVSSGRQGKNFTQASFTKIGPLATGSALAVP